MKTELAKKKQNFQCLRYNSSSIHMFITRLPGKGQISKEVFKKNVVYGNEQQITH